LFYGCRFDRRFSTPAEAYLAQVAAAFGGWRCVNNRVEIKKSNYLFVVALPPAQQIHAHNKNFFYTNTVVRNFISYSPIASRLNFLSKPNASNG
jgi:hypothetical protein